MTVSGKNVLIYGLIGIVASTAVILMVEKTLEAVDAARRQAPSGNHALDGSYQAAGGELPASAADYEVNRKTGQKQFLR